MTISFADIHVTQLSPTARQTLEAAWLPTLGHSVKEASDAVSIERARRCGVASTSWP